MRYTGPRRWKQQNILLYTTRNSIYILEHYIDSSSVVNLLIQEHVVLSKLTGSHTHTRTHMYPEAVATVLTAAHLNRARRSSRPTGPPQATAYKRTYMNIYICTVCGWVRDQDPEVWSRLWFRPQIEGWLKIEALKVVFGVYFRYKLITTRIPLIHITYS